MPPRTTPTARQLRVGLELRKMRDSARKTSADAASTLGLVEDGVYAMCDSKRPDREPLLFTTEELTTAGIDPARFGLSV